MLSIELINTGGVGLESDIVVNVTELIELFCVFPEIYNGQYTYINIHSYMFDLYRDLTYSLIENQYGKLPLFDALDAYFSLIALEQMRKGEFVKVGLNFNLPNDSFNIGDGEEAEFIRVPKTLFNRASALEESTFWVHFFNTLERCKDEIRNKHSNTNS